MHQLFVCSEGDPNLRFLFTVQNNGFVIRQSFSKNKNSSKKRKYVCTKIIKLIRETNKRETDYFVDDDDDDMCDGHADH